jgi:hypothetical protein
MLANATACGKTIMAPVRAANMSNLKVPDVTRGNQPRKGNHRDKVLIPIIVPSK